MRQSLAILACAVLVALLPTAAAGAFPDSPRGVPDVHATVASLGERKPMMLREYNAKDERSSIVGFDVGTPRRFEFAPGERIGVTLSHSVTRATLRAVTYGSRRQRTIETTRMRPIDGSSRRRFAGVLGGSLERADAVSIAVGYPRGHRPRWDHYRVERATFALRVAGSGQERPR